MREQLPWDLRLAEKAERRKTALQEKWERAAHLRLSRCPLLVGGWADLTRAQLSRSRSSSQSLYKTIF